MMILLDVGPLGDISNPHVSVEALACTEWMETRLGLGDLVMVPAIADYEVRRELVRAGKRAGIRRLDALKARIGYLPLTETMLLVAADVWAAARQRGRPTAAHQALDGDVTLAAQAEVARRAGFEVMVATGNVRHLSLFTDARLWRDIP